MKKYALLAAVIFIASSAGITTAYFGNMEKTDKPHFENREEMIEKKVEMLGLNLEEVQVQLEEGKAIKEIVLDAGITKEDIFENKKAFMVEHINQMVADGKITQEQADEKIEWMEERNEQYEQCSFQDKFLLKMDGTERKGMRIRFLK